MSRTSRTQRQQNRRTTSCGYRRPRPAAQPGEEKRVSRPVEATNRCTRPITMGRRSKTRPPKATIDENPKPSNWSSEKSPERDRDRVCQNFFEVS